MKYINSTIWGMAFLLLTTSSVARAEEIKEKPIARVFNKQIYYSDISQDVHALPQYLSQKSEKERAEWIKQREFQILEFLIYSELQKEFLNRTDMNPTNEELQLHIDFSIKSDANRLGELETQRKEILTQIESPNLVDTQRESLNDHLKTLDQLIKNQKQRKEEEKLIPNYTEIKKESNKRIASSMVTAWKFNKALYEEYGGRVIFQQFGWEPIDAAKIFLEKHKEEKSFEVFDASFDKIFNRMYEYFEMDHLYMDKEVADKYFSKPWWDPTFEPL